ncbi:MAG: MarR family transcriptional regulator, partial [Planctomycetota bacterium]
YNLTYQQYSVLMIMATENKKMSITSLVNYIGVRQPTMTGIINRLEQKKFVKKKINTVDNRRIEIVLTSKGKKIVNKIDPKQYHEETKFFEVFSTTEKKQLTKLLSKLLQA